MNYAREIKHNQYRTIGFSYYIKNYDLAHLRFLIETIRFKFEARNTCC